MPRGKSSHRWRTRQSRDPYVEKAGRQGFRSRAAFKLREIDEREKLFRPRMLVIDLGAAPGGWSQVAARRVVSARRERAPDASGAASRDPAPGRIIAIDRLPMDPIEGVEIITADFMSDEGLAAIRDLVGGRPADLVMSDLAPNISGNRAIDQPRSFALADAALEFARQTLAPGGAFLCKVFQGEGQRAFEIELGQNFGRVKRLKPKASRPESREIYLLASAYRMV